MNNLTRKPKLPEAPANLARCTRLALAGLIVLLTMATLPSLAKAAPARRKGKVLVVRGAFTIFSLGLDTLGSKLRKQGCDVTVSTAATSSLNAGVIIEEKRKNPDMPVILIGHSRGGLLAPDLAKQFGDAGMKVDLVVIIDNTHKITMPRNVTRTVNLYHTNMFGVMHGLQVKGLQGGGQVLNVDIKNIPGRDKAGYLDHFNIEESPWIHDIVIGEVLRFTPLRSQPQPTPQQMATAKPPAARPQHRPVHIKTSPLKEEPTHRVQPPVLLAPATPIRQPQSIASLPVKRASKTTSTIHQRYANKHPASRSRTQTAAAEPGRIETQGRVRAMKPAFEYGNIKNPEIVVE